MAKTALRKQMEQLNEGWRTIDSLYDQFARSAGLSYMSLSVLEYIYETSGTCTQKLICEYTHYPKQTVNMIIRTLWEKGYVEMKEIDSDRRNKAINLSKTGREYAGKVVGKLAQVEEHVMNQMTDAQFRLMLDLTQKIENSMRENMQI